VAVRGEVVRARIDAAIRGARAVLASGSGYIVLWTCDTNPDGHVNLSELELIEVASGSTTVTAYLGPSATGDPTYPTSSNFYAVAQAAKSSGYFPATTWATNISNLAFIPDTASPILAKFVTWSLTLTDQQLSVPVVGGVTLAVWSQPR